MTQPTTDQGATPNPTAGATPEAASTTTTTPTADELKAQLADALSQIKKLNKESETRRKSLDQYEKEKADREALELSETQKLQKQIEALQAEKAKSTDLANQRLIRAEVLAAASADFAHPEDVYTVIREKLTVSDDGKVDGLPEALAELKKTRPTWLKTYRPSGVQPTNPGENATGQGETDAQRRSRVYGSGVNPFDPSWAKEHGGGVVVNSKTID